MRITAQGARRWLLIAPVALVAFWPSPRTVQAEEPTLAIHLVGGGSWVYAVSEIERLGFEGDTLVVAGAGGSDSYLVGTIERIDFLWGVTRVTGPEDAPICSRLCVSSRTSPTPFHPRRGSASSCRIPGGWNWRSTAWTGG